MNASPEYFESDGAPSPSTTSGIQAVFLCSSSLSSSDSPGELAFLDALGLSSPNKRRIMLIGYFLLLPHNVQAEWRGEATQLQRLLATEVLVDDRWSNLIEILTEVVPSDIDVLIGCSGQKPEQPTGAVIFIVWERN